jgi:pimeloyl-ACP methyl ester carboxylesterase
MSREVVRHYVTVTGRWGRRQVHYRCAGKGPLLLLLHQSPQSSRELVPLMQQWAERFTLLAPDTPGYGLSDPLGVAEASLDDFADAAIEFLDAVGATRFGIYGFHTGGMIALALADRHPQRVAAVACNGVAVLTAEERARILAEYLPAFEPRWDGGHLAWLWARIREQAVFFPWHERRLACRMDFPMPPPERQQESVLEFLRAADHYHVAYRGAFVYRADEVVARLGVPALITAARRDPIAPHLGRLGRPAANVTVIGSQTPQEALQRCHDQLLAHPAPAARLHAPEASVDSRLRRALLDVDGRAAHLLLGGAGDALPLLLLHDAGSSSARLAALATRLAVSRPVIVPDLPGHGESDPAEPGAVVDVATCAAAVAGLLGRLQVREIDVLGVGAGGAVALALAGHAGIGLRRLAWRDPPAIPAADLDAWRESGLPSLAADWHGGHLSRAWHAVRDGRLYFPWFRRDQQGIRWLEPDLDERGIQRDVTELLKADGAWQALLADVWRQSVPDRLAASGRASCTTLCSAASSPWRLLAAAAAAAANCRFVALADGDAAQVAELAL